MPFVADRGREVEHAPPSGLHAGEYGLLLLAFAFLKPLARCAVGVGVGQREEVGQFERTARSGDAGELVGGIVIFWTMTVGWIVPIYSSFQN